MTCSWSWAESWPQAQVLEGKSGIFQESSCFRRSVPGPGPGHKSRANHRGGKVKNPAPPARIWTKQPDLELKIQVPK